MGISSHKTELANCGSSNRAETLQGLDFGNRSQVNNLASRNVSITAENMVNMGQDYCLYYHGEYALHEIRENTDFNGRIRT